MTTKTLQLKSPKFRARFFKTRRTGSDASYSTSRHSTSHMSTHAEARHYRHTQFSTGLECLWSLEISSSSSSLEFGAIALLVLSQAHHQILFSLPHISASTSTSTSICSSRYFARDNTIICRDDVSRSSILRQSLAASIWRLIQLQGTSTETSRLPVVF